MRPSASVAASNEPSIGPHGPVRTCVGCRERAPRSDLVRVVLEGDHVVIDPGASRPGRGAWLHRRPECLDLAIRRKAFPRALRVSVADASSLEFG